MKLLVSIKNVDEIDDAVNGGADIIDVKDPEASSLGLPDMDIVKNVVNRIGFKKEVSVALGDIDREDKTLKYISFATAILGVNYVKIGLAINLLNKAEKIIRDIQEILKSFNKTKLVAVGYADFSTMNFVNPMSLIDIASKIEIEGVMIDTFKKNGFSTFDLLSIDYLKTFVKKAHDLNLKTAIAGGIKLQHISFCIGLGFDVVGVRGAVCKGKRSDKISKDLVLLFRKEIDKMLNKVAI